MAGRQNRTGPMPLMVAAWRLATPRMRAEVVHERSKPRPKFTRRHFEDSQVQQAAQAIDAFNEHLSAIMDEISDPHEPSPQMRRRLIEQLGRGKFEAFGLRTKPDVGRTPERIPRFIFDGKPKISWTKSTIENCGHKFEIVKVERLAKFKTEPISQSVARGRPTKEEEIERAIDGLLAKGVSLDQIERRHAREKIKKYAKDNLGANTDIGYSDPVLQRQLLKRFGKKS